MKFLNYKHLSKMKSISYDKLEVGMYVSGWYHTNNLGALASYNKTYRLIGKILSKSRERYIKEPVCLDLFKGSFCIDLNECILTDYEGCRVTIPKYSICNPSPYAISVIRYML